MKLYVSRISERKYSGGGMKGTLIIGLSPCLTHDGKKEAQNVGFLWLTKKGVLI